MIEGLSNVVPDKKIFSGTYDMSRGKWNALRNEVESYLLLPNVTATLRGQKEERDNPNSLLNKTKVYPYRFTVKDGIAMGDYAVIFTERETDSIHSLYEVAVTIAYHDKPLMGQLAYLEPEQTAFDVTPWGTLLNKAMHRRQRLRLVALVGLLGLAFYAGFHFHTFYYGV